MILFFCFLIFWHVRIPPSCWMLWYRHELLAYFVFTCFVLLIPTIPSHKSNMIISFRIIIVKLILNKIIIIKYFTIKAYIIAKEYNNIRLYIIKGYIIIRKYNFIKFYQEQIVLLEDKNQKIYYSDCNGIQTNNYLLCKRKLIHLTKQIWLNSWMFVYELDGFGFEFRCSHVKLQL